MIITVPVKSHYIKFLRRMYQFNDVLVISRNNPLGTFLIEMLREKPRVYPPSDTSDLPLLKIQTSKEKTYAHLIYLPEESITAINRYIDDLIHAHFLTHMYALTEVACMDVQEAIYEFIERYDFQDHEITFESLKKYHYRKRQAEEALILQ